ncbi:hypothetical protein BpHYR1_021801 [Brachionus plicatilis]|uniref:Uncharacterized protein n=1 Tax=Brachionus plicatilis TaxID=10195 RepID=A0A3M7QY29_BRAPC|nr:hypothetical protein BpHYR1_021801 [Brachionus plicatilis]
MELGTKINPEHFSYGTVYYNPEPEHPKKRNGTEVLQKSGTDSKIIYKSQYKQFPLVDLSFPHRVHLHHFLGGSHHRLGRKQFDLNFHLETNISQIE